ncbi:MULTISPECIES: MauE/DoxX family redox-associated membrane protein [unclassified Marinobacter]|uniref:MauE/DoxX family redox-associated membrane protein n=1 Tax=unclassified Marinobacter TaxID=83889 RepID=UPI000C01BDE6|nr:MULTISPECIES: MauE/DoxX family redox-associated membrane protein [unclassified Marinobacter]PFG08659.1 glutaredoxin [Marinobacter sp. LV10MA510-1]PFG54492.1 glutaredoxin [Marinobacter sp. LV10R520-4]
MPNDTQMKKAVLYRMVMPGHTCPFGLKSKDLLEREGFEVEDHSLETREDTDVFMREHDVNTTPQTFIGDERIGGYEDLQVHFGKKDPEADDTTYQPIIALFSVAALLALAFAWVALPSVFAWQTLGWFISISMVLLGLQKFKDIESFSTMFLNYDLLAKRWVRYGYVYPFVETGAGLLMTATILPWLSIPGALFIGTVGAVSVIKAVYIDKRELKCACVGGDSNVPLGFVSLTENLMMVGMAVVMTIVIFT